MLTIPPAWEILCDELDPFAKTGRQLVLSGPYYHYILAGWSRDYSGWCASHWESWHKHGEYVSGDHAAMVKWCVERAEQYAEGKAVANALVRNPQEMQSMLVNLNAHECKRCTRRTANLGRVCWYCLKKQDRDEKAEKRDARLAE